MLKRAWRRFCEDCRDLWILITKGQPEPLDELLPWKIMAEMAKQPIPQVDWFPEMCENYARHPTAFWNDWWLFDGEPCANREPTPDEVARAQERVLRVLGLQISRPAPYTVMPDYHPLMQASSLMSAGVSLQSLSAQRLLGIL